MGRKRYTTQIILGTEAEELPEASIVIILMAGMAITGGIDRETMATGGIDRGKLAIGGIDHETIAMGSFLKVVLVAAGGTETIVTMGATTEMTGSVIVRVRTTEVTAVMIITIGMLGEVMAAKGAHLVMSRGTGNLITTDTNGLVRPTMRR